MATISELKEQSITETPLLLFECELGSGVVERWSTQAVDFEGHHYDARVMRHDLFEIRAGATDGIDSVARVSLWLANADSRFSQIERSTGWKGSRVTVRFVFFDLRAGVAASEAAVLFKGIADAPDEITESTLRLTVVNSLNMQRVLLPDVRVERRCPWKFPSTAAQRMEAAGGADGKYSPFYRCGYSPDVTGGAGTRNGATAYTTCDRTREQCAARGMFDEDSSHRATRRFGAIEFVPPTTVVRSYGEKGNHVSQPVENEGRYNDFVPLVYGTAWYKPPIVFSKNDGNLTRMDVLLGMGEIQGVIKVLVNDIDIPAGVSGKNMTATGWFNVVTLGGRTGSFNAEYVDSSGKALGDPYGSMAVLNVVVPNRVNDGRSLPDVQVLVEGLKLERFDLNGASLGESFTNNTAWVLLDVLRRCGWRISDIDTGSFAQAAAYCGELISARDAHGNQIDIPRFQCNLVLRKRRTAADVIRGIRNSARLFLTYGLGGRLALKVENTRAIEGIAYEFGDGTDGLSGILREANGAPSIRVFTLSTAETPNRLTVEFQDAFNEYQQDSLSIVDVDDTLKAGQEISLALPALGIPNFNQAARIARFQLDKSIAGNTYVEFETSVRGLGLKPGDLITVTYLKEGFDRQPFRILGVSPGMNYRTARITAQIHDDGWYSDSNADPFASGSAGRQQGYGIGIPRPLAGKVRDEYGDAQLGVVESASAGADGTTHVNLAVDFEPPRQPAAVGLGTPVVSLAAHTDAYGGSLAGSETFYYAVTAGDASGQESGLSFVVRATIPAGTNSNSVTLSGLSFPSDATCFHVYRGANPSQLLRIAHGVAIAGSFTDTGLAAELVPPPDANYDHVNMYWRLEMQPENAVTAHGANFVGNDTLGMSPNAYRGTTVRITRGKGAGQERTITGNDATTLTVGAKWAVEPDETSWFVVAEAGWHFGAAGSCGPLEFEVPNRVGATVHVCGRAANVHDRECAYELSPVTRRRITGDGAALDTGVAGRPVFGLTTSHRGEISLATVAFEELTNTRTITSGTLTLHYWNELAGPSHVLLNADVGAEDTTIDLAVAGTAVAGDYIQIDAEVLRVESVLNGGMRYGVARGAQGSTAAEHPAEAVVYPLSTSTVIIPFAKDFFGSPSSGNFSYTTLLPDARVASAELFVTNAKGNSETGFACFTETTDGGLRTLSGGQFSIQVEGYLAAEAAAAPPVVVQDTHSVRDISAIVAEAPTGGPVELDLRQNGGLYCHLTIPADRTYSDVVKGFGLPPLQANARLTLDIVSVPGSNEARPGRDLTVTIRL
ncbi:MAG: phage tail protein [Acidobacteriota bacterium]